MQEEYEAKLLKMKGEIEAQNQNEQAKQEALDREKQMRAEMEAKMEQDRLEALKA